ncbi:MarR family transcriptional regulator [Corynebacterium sp. ES2794-CONJ1]|uniref:MarR family winged helix-turn-helix transcriptional regulator n=1 Tax=unclassified Corynebacterium TaxID=2624378 RepID=UPI002169D178|nr:MULTISPECIES: MarR family transcriptional regulator [unclassified Corynebacterium]MCS4489842.1 MarR family transcriptional regulator [Corynebacterium sp. ES2775-CONJ]MCS4491794.1 MarR family transcriptional regulator [Corynebacterium sp. ES2715-CONJ3]MCU9519300.1 MarR family transcriptional regulator [Corynebacterium sp. ES2794-CONJ1]
MSTPRWLTDEEQVFWRLLLSTVRKVQNTNEQVLHNEHKLTSSEFAVLVCLSEAPDEMLRLRDLCANLEWDRSRTSHQVTRMEKRGLVAKSKCSGDARGIHISLSAEGKKRLVEAAPTHVNTVRSLIFDTITPELMAAVEIYLQNIQDQDLSAPDIDSPAV